MGSFAKLASNLAGVVKGLSDVAAAATATAEQVGKARSQMEEHHGSMQKSAEAAAVGVVRSMSSASEAVSTHADTIERRGKQISEQIDKVRQEGGTRLDDLIEDMDMLSYNGNLWATSLLDLLRQVKQGTLDGKDVLFAFGDAVVQFEGQIRPLRDVLSDVLPTMGQVQSQLREMTEELKEADPSEIVGRLREQYNEFAQSLARGVEMFKQGQISLERLMALVQQAQRYLPGSETDALAKLLEEALRAGRL